MNNRQPNRRRGRGNNRAQQQNRGGGDYQNRIDNRARGNAAQMLEKYKKLANDAQLNGDRVQAEYYHQFADHYFRVLADAKARQDEQQAARQARWQERRGPDEGDYSVDGDRDGTESESYDPYASQRRASPSDEDEYSDGATDNGSTSDDFGDDGQRDAPRRQNREPSRSDRGDRNTGRNRAPRDRQQSDRRPARDDRGDDRSDMPVSGDMDAETSETRPYREPSPHRETKRPARRPRKDDIDDMPATLDLAVLPPAIGGNEQEAPVKKPRATRRPRKAEGEAVEAAE